MWDNITASYLETKVHFRNPAVKLMRGRAADKAGFVRLVFTHQKWDGIDKSEGEDYVDSVLSVLHRGAVDPTDGLPLAPITGVHAKRLEELYSLAESLFRVESGAGANNPSSRKSMLSSIFSQFQDSLRKQPEMAASLEEVCRSVVEMPDGSLLPDTAKCRTHLAGINKLLQVESIYSTKNCIVTTVLVNHQNGDVDKLHKQLRAFAGPIIACNYVKERYASALREAAYYASAGNSASGAL